jgi:hypothetical protein
VAGVAVADKVGAGRRRTSPPVAACRSAPGRAATPSGCSPSSSRVDPGRQGHPGRQGAHVAAPARRRVRRRARVPAFTFLFSVWVNAPLLQLANDNQTPNPSKAPWYFLGLQELLTMFHPMIAGVTIPGVGLIVLIFAPYIDKNPSNKPEDRKFATSLMTVHLMFWAVLTMIGSFFRGPGFNFVLPWVDGLFFEL